jgi:plastocyanin
VLHTCRRAAACVAVIALTALPSLAGQRRVNVNATSFIDSTLVANPADQIVWVWTAGSHTVTSGTSNSITGDGTFNSGVMGGSGAAFSWKVPLASSGVQRYYCFPHFGIGMHGRINFSAAPVAVSEFRISEVRFSTAHDSDYVEIANLGDDVGNLGRYRISVTSATQLSLTPTDIVVPVGGRVVLWLGRSGIGSATEQFFPGLSLPRSGSAALYVPTTKNADTLRTRDDLMVDFVQWGTGGQLNEATAVTAGYWTTGLFADAPADGHTLEFCGLASERGPTFWRGSPVSTPGLANCVTPARASSWGRIKAIYR